MDKSTPGPDTAINLKSLAVVAKKLRALEAPFKARQDPSGLGIGAAALLVEMAGDEIERLRSSLAAHKACVEALADLVPAIKKHINASGGADGYLLARLSDAEGALAALEANAGETR